MGPVWKLNYNDKQKQFLKFRNCIFLAYKAHEVVPHHNFWSLRELLYFPSLPQKHKLKADLQAFKIAMLHLKNDDVYDSWN